MAKTSNILKPLYEDIISKTNFAIEEGDCPSLNMFYHNDVDDSINLKMSITSIPSAGTTESTIVVSNDQGISFNLQDIKLKNMSASVKGIKEDLFIKEHLEDTTFSTTDTLEVSGVGLLALKVGDILLFENKVSVFMKTDFLNLPRTSYGNRNFYKTEAFILTLEVKTRDDVNCFLLEDTTSAIREILENYGAVIDLEESGRKFSINILDSVKIHDLEENSTKLQKRTIQIMLGYNMVNTKFS